jgi:alpha-beta hydrolase superfamily lysophospholipase
VSSAADWRPDVLGEPFQQLTLHVEPDVEGEVVATLVRYAAAPHLHLRRPAASGIDVLYVHGWSDYFFQTHLARFWHEAGARFFALDLRKYGRSLRPGQTPGFVDDLATYDEDIEAALEAMGHGKDRRDHQRSLVLLGHSTGGLTLSLWADRHPGRARALILNSPWLEFQARSAGRSALTPFVDLQARLDPKAPMPNVDLGFYTRTVSRTLGGEWDYDLAWRPVRGFPVHPAWLRAVLVGHTRVAAGLAVDAPVLTLLSKRSTLVPYWSEEMRRSDSVLVVRDIAAQALRLGDTVTIGWIDGALHDVFLSPEPIREVAYGRIERWLSGYAPVSEGSRTGARRQDLRS